MLSCAGMPRSAAQSATAFMIWVIWVAAMAMDFGEAIGALPRVKPLANMSQSFGHAANDRRSAKHG